MITRLICQLVYVWQFHEQPSRSVYIKRLINIGASAVAPHRQVTDHFSHSDTFNDLNTFSAFFAEFRSLLKFMTNVN